MKDGEMFFGWFMSQARYGWYVFRHKFYVFIECCKAGMPVAGLFHDTSKLRPSEWLPYARHFYPKGRAKQRRDKTGYYKPTETGDAAFDFAWLLHQKRNRHHWQWFVLPEDEGGVKVLPMSSKARREMLCDWRGASRAQGYKSTDVPSWYEKNGKKMQLHPETRAWIEAKLAEQMGEKA